MTTQEWAALVVIFLLPMIAGALWDINKKLQRLIEIAHRIRINDRNQVF